MNYCGYCGTAVSDDMEEKVFWNIVMRLGY